jgi:hypothetical protein
MPAHVVLQMAGETVLEWVERVRGVIDRDVGPRTSWPENACELKPDTLRCSQRYRKVWRPRPLKLSGYSLRQRCKQ